MCGDFGERSEKMEKKYYVFLVHFVRFFQSIFYFLF